MTDEVPQINTAYYTELMLYMSYMPFVTGGGLFIRTNSTFALGAKVKLSVTLLEEQEPYLVDGKVVWITPKGAQDNKPAGVGVQFLGEQSRQLSNKIETCLAVMNKAQQITDTL